jgi:hypothetical protein
MTMVADGSRLYLLSERSYDPLLSNPSRARRLAWQSVATRTPCYKACIFEFVQSEVYQGNANGIPAEGDSSNSTPIFQS